MNFQFYVEKLQDSDIFKKFMKENPKAYLCSGFFTIDKEGSDNQRHLDFFVPGKKKIFGFKMNEKIEMFPMEAISEQIPEKISLDVDFEFEEVEKLISEKMIENKIKNKFQKNLISFQNVEGKNMLICTVFLSGFGLLKIYIDSDKKEITLFEEKSFFDIIRKA